MLGSRLHGRALVVRSALAILIPAWAALAGQQEVSPSPSLTLAEKEAFLLKARIVQKWHTPRGVAYPWQAILDDGQMQHDAHIQTVEVSKASYQTKRGIEFNFRDSYKFNIAAYELAKILELDMVPPSVERTVGGEPAAVTWWVDNKMFDEVDRVLRRIQPPDLDSWNKQMHVVRVFDELIYNTDRNKGNLVITRDWQIWMIDHTKAFRTQTTLLEPGGLAQCDRKLLAKLRELRGDTVRERLRRHLTAQQINSMMARRDKVVKFFDDEIARKGEGAVLFDLSSVRK